MQVRDEILAEDLCIRLGINWVLGRRVVVEESWTLADVAKADGVLAL